MQIHDGEKSAAEIERESIQVVTNEPENKEPPKEEENNQEENAEEENEEQQEEETAEEETNEENEEEQEEENEEDGQTDEQKAAAAKERENKKVEKRIARAIAKQKAAEDRAAELEAKLAAAGTSDGKLTPEEAKKLAKEEAARLKAEEDFVNLCNNLADGAKKADKDFDANIKIVEEEIGAIPGQIIGALGDIDNGADVLAYLAKNIDEFEDLYALAQKNRTTKLGVDIGKLAAKLAAEKKPKPKKLSKVPNPNPELNGSNRSNSAPINYNDPKMNMDDYVTKRNEELRKKGKLHLVS